MAGQRDRDLQMVMMRAKLPLTLQASGVDIMEC